MVPVIVVVQADLGLSLPFIVPTRILTVKPIFIAETISCERAFLSEDLIGNVLDLTWDVRSDTSCGCQ